MKAQASLVERDVANSAREESPFASRSLRVPTKVHPKTVHTADRSFMSVQSDYLIPTESRSSSYVGDATCSAVAKVVFSACAPFLCLTYTARASLFERTHTQHPYLYTLRTFAVCSLRLPRDLSRYTFVFRHQRYPHDAEQSANLHSVLFSPACTIFKRSSCIITSDKRQIIRPPSPCILKIFLPDTSLRTVGCSCRGLGGRHRFYQ